MKIQTAFGHVKLLTAFGLVLVLLLLAGCLNVEVLLDRGGPQACREACAPDRVVAVQRKRTHWTGDRATICSCWNDKLGVEHVPLDDLGR